MTRSRAIASRAALLLACFCVPPTTANATSLPPGQALAFPSASLRFPTSAIDFGASALSFPARVDRRETAATIEVILPADVLFDFDKADIRPAAEATMHEVAQLIRDRSHGPITIQGYTDALGTDAYNQRLSERRAASVRTWLVSREGLPAKQFTVSGRGARDPVASNRKPDGSDDPEGRQLNRRVTLTIRK